MEKEYIVTLYNREDLEQFYTDMKVGNFPLMKKRPISRNTHYKMTAEQAETLRQDPRVWGVECVEDFHAATQGVDSANNVAWQLQNEEFWKNSGAVSINTNPNMRQWGQLHVAGSSIQRRKNSWGDPTGTELVNDSIDVFSDGRNVDVVIVDDPVSPDSEEWISPTTGNMRFVPYQWFNELNALVNSIDDDNQTEPSGTIDYGNNATQSRYHGIHVTGTACGRHYGWAREANIYNLAVTASWDSGQSVGAFLIFDYLRAFHQSKPDNPDTNRKNPTITNHSYGGIRYMPQKGFSGDDPIYRLDFSDVTQVNWRGQVYNAQGPGPSGWTQNGLETDFGLRFGVDTYPSYSSSIAADVQDAINDGVVVIGAAGNDNLLMGELNDEDWDNQVTISGVGTIYYNRGAWPNSPDTDVINVGALQDHSEHRRSTYTMFGPGITVFSPGDSILSSFGNTGFNDGKYSIGNYYYPISGTSMASPQVCGVIACMASSRHRFTNWDAIGIIDKLSVYGDMTFDVNGGGLNDNSCQQRSPNKYLHIENPRPLTGFTDQYISDRKISLSQNALPSIGGQGQTWPRRPTFFSGMPGQGATGNNQTFTLQVGNSGASDYTITGTDRQNSFTNALDPTLNINDGDIIEFSVSAAGHPFLIKTALTTGTGNQLPSYQGSGSGVLGNGKTSGTVTLYTSGLSGTTLYYICQFHGNMYGSIVIA